MKRKNIVFNGVFFPSFGIDIDILMDHLSECCSHTNWPHDKMPNADRLRESHQRKTVNICEQFMFLFSFLIKSESTESISGKSFMWTASGIWFFRENISTHLAKASLCDRYVECTVRCSFHCRVWSWKKCQIDLIKLPIIAISSVRQCAER